MRGPRPLAPGLLALCAAALAALPVPVAANGAANGAAIGTWTTALYRPTHPPHGARALPPEAACIDAVLEAERDAGIPGHMLLAIGFTESGRMTPERLFTIWPWTVNAEGQSRYFPTKGEAIAFVRALRAGGVQSIDVGCLQVNLKWHPDAFPNLETAFDPVANARYGARFLGELYRQHGTLDVAVGRYHSAQSERGEAYRQRVSGNMRWAARAIDYLRTLAAGPRDRPSGAAPAWGKAELGRLSFLSGLFADGPARPLLPDAREGR